MLSSLADWVTDVIDRLGYVGVALLVALENLFPPIPSEIVLPFAGFVARDGRAALPGMILAATIGSLLGAWVLYGIAAAIGVLVGRCVPLVRSLVSIPAGFRRMRFGAFTLYTAIGSLIWNTGLIGTGYLLRENWHDVEPILDAVQYAVIAVILGALGWFVWRRVLSPAARDQEAEYESVGAE
jgi:membrane protein DedA with SNARE-associated domain